MGPHALSHLDVARPHNRSLAGAGICGDIVSVIVRVDTIQTPLGLKCAITDEAYQYGLTCLHSV